MPAALRVATWNIRAAIGPGPFPEAWWRRVDLERLGRIATVIRELRAEVVALQEVAVLTVDGILCDNASELSAATGMELRYAATRHLAIVEADGRTSGAGVFGNAILSSVPINATRTVALPGAPPDAEVEPAGSTHPMAGIRYRDAPESVREPRCLVVSDVTLGGATIRIGSVHLSHEGSGERALQAEACDVAMSEGDVRRGVLAGDMNAPIESSDLAVLRDGWTDAFAEAGAPPGHAARTTTEDGHRIDHILVRGLEVVGCRRADGAAWLSDHLPVVATLAIPDG